MSEQKPTAIDLFSGCGGLTQGLKDAGFKVVGGVEIDERAVASYKLNHPEVHIWTQDIRTIETSEMLATLQLAPGDLDLVAGCPPCQGFSSMRTLNGSRSVADDRKDLIKDFIRVVIALKPRAIMMENVPGLLNDDRLTAALKELAEAGYHVDSHDLDSVVRVLNAADFGVPQRRKRLILMTSVNGNIPFAKKTKVVTTVSQAIVERKIPRPHADPLHNYRTKRTERIEKLIANIPLDGGSRADLPSEFQLTCHKGFDGFKDVYGRMSLEKVSPTITSGCINPSKGRFLHPTENRPITLREAALLQSFPVDYKFSNKGGRAAIASQIGNALPPLFIRAHAQEILKALNAAK